MKPISLNKDFVSDDLLITVAVVTYNHCGSLRECIDSIAQQSYKQIDLVVVDDFSCDFDKDAVESYIHRQSSEAIKSVTVEGLKAHHGAVAAYKRALELAKGSYILFIAGDDCLADANVIEQAAKALSRSPVEVLQGQAKLLTTEEEIVLPSKQCLELLDVGKAFDLFRVTVHQPFSQLLCIQAAFFQTACLRKLNAFPENYQFAVDWPLYAQLLMNGAKFSRFSQVMTCMRDNGAYRVFSVGNVYIRRGYLNEAAQAIREFAISARRPGISQEEALLFESAANAYECAAVKIFSWYYYSLGDKLAWYREHKDFIRMHKATYPYFGASKLPLKWLFFVLLAISFLWIWSTKLPENLAYFDSGIPFGIATAAFLADLFHSYKKSGRGVVLVDYCRAAGYLFVILICAVTMKKVDILSLSNVLLLIMVCLISLGVVDIVLRVARRINRRTMKRRMGKE